MPTELVKKTTSGSTTTREKVVRNVDPAVIACIKTGSYTGDGTTNRGITGIGFQPKYLRIWKRLTTEGNMTTFETTTEIIDDHANGMAVMTQDAGTSTTHETRENRIRSLDADGFTVDDDGTDLGPNKNGTVYNYMALG